MRQSSGIHRIGNGATRRRWAGLLLSLLLAFGTLAHLGHPTPAHAGMGQVVQIASADNGTDPCERNCSAMPAHCGASGACAFNAPDGAGATIFDRAPANRPVTAEALVFGQVIDPQFRPPRLPLQA